MKPNYRPGVKNGLPEERETANAANAGNKQAGQSVSFATSGPNPTAKMSRGLLNKSSRLSARKKIQLPLRKGKLRHKDPLPQSSRRLSSAKPEVTGLTPPPRPRTGQTGKLQKPTAKLRTSQKPSAKTGVSQKRGTAPHGGTGRRASEEGAGTSVDVVGMPKTSKEVRALLLRTPDPDSDSSLSPSPSPRGYPKRHHTACLSRCFLRQLEWYKVARRDKKWRDKLKRLDELSSKMTVKLDGDSLKNGPSGDAVLLELKGSVEPKLIPGDVCQASGSSDSWDPSRKKWKLSSQSGRGVQSSRAPRRKWPRRQCRRLDYSSDNSSCGSPGLDTGGAVTPAQTPIPSPICIPATNTFFTLDLRGAHLNTCTISCSVAGTGASNTDPGSSTDTHAVPDTSTSSLSKSWAFSTPHDTSLVVESCSDFASPTMSPPPTALAPPLHSAPPTYLTLPAGMSPADVELLHMPGETSLHEGPLPPPMKTAVTAGVCACEKAADLRERLVDTSSDTATAAPRTCNPAESSFKTARFHPAKSQRRANPGLSDKATAASDVKHLTAAESHGSHLGSITGQPESQSQVSAGRKCPPSKRAAAVKAPPRLTKSPGSQRPDSQSVFLCQADKIEISPSGSVLSSKQRSEQVNKKCPRPIKSVTPTYRRTPKSKRGPPLRDGVAEPPLLFSATPAYSTPAKQNRQAKQPPTPRPKPPYTPRPKLPPRRESDTGHRITEPARHPEASPVRNLHAAALQHPDTPICPCPLQRAAVPPGLSSPSTAGSQASANLQSSRRRAAAEHQVLTGPPPLPAVRERCRGLIDSSFSSARASPNTPMPGDTTRQCLLTPPATNRNSSRVKKKKTQAPKDLRKTLSGRGDREVRPKTGSRKSAGREQYSIRDNSTTASSVTSHKGVPQSRDRACRIATNPTYLAAGEGDLTTRGEGSPWTPACACALRPPSPELTDTPVGVTSSLLSQQSPLSLSQLLDSVRVTGQVTVRQENSSPARTPGFLSRLQAKRLRCQELERRLELLTAALQETREELEREMRQSHREQREEREEEIGGERKRAELGHRSGKH